MHNILTFDVEDWYQALDIPNARWASFERRLAVGLEFVLETLAWYRVRATFFVLGITACEHSAWVRRIADAGHEIGTHGWSHTPVYRQSQAEFRGELRRSLDFLRDLTGQPVRGHRAAMFSITARSRWALAELGASGLCYDSSIFPVHNYRYGIPGAQRFPHPLSVPGLWEFPIATISVGHFNLPIGGGFYMRFCPYAFVRRALRSLNQQGQPAVVYFHPWEFDADQPRVRHESHWLARATHYYRLGSTRETLRRLLKDFQWTTMSNHPIS